jgi:uncharacterized protein (TIGR02594 family)
LGFFGKFWNWLFGSKKQAPVIVTPPVDSATKYDNHKWHSDFDAVILDEAHGRHPKQEIPGGNLANFIKAICVAESGLDFNEVYHEPAPLNNYSVGLMQLSVSDVKNYRAERFNIKSNSDLMNPIKNLRLGTHILLTLLEKHPSENVYQAGGRYWSVLRWDKYWPGKKQSGFERFRRALYANRVEPTSNPSGDPKWLEIARAEMGIKEIQPGDNPRIIAYHKETTLRATDDETPWCSSFVNWVMAECGIFGTKSAMARSWLTWKNGIHLQRPVLGCIVVFWRGSPSASTGHVAFWLGENDGVVTTLGGNQSNSVCISHYGKDQVLGYIWPKGF